MNTSRVLLRRWYITTVGMLMSVLACAITYSLVPQQYMSTATAALVAPSKPGPLFDNPLMMPFATSLAATAQGLVESLNAPNVPDELGLIDGQDSLTVKSTGANAGGPASTPFLYITGFSTQPDKAAAIVSAALDMAQHQLAGQQSYFHVSRSNGLRLARFVEPTAPVVQPGVREVIAAVVLLAGLGVTIAAVCVIDRRLGRRVRFQPGSSPDPDSLNTRITYHPNAENSTPHSNGSNGVLLR